LKSPQGVNSYTGSFVHESLRETESVVGVCFSLKTTKNEMVNFYSKTNEISPFGELYRNLLFKADASYFLIDSLLKLVV
jgi:hypothetical protein